MAIGNPRLITVADAARQAGVTGRTLRYYEELGLLLPHDRPEDIDATGRMPSTCWRASRTCNPSASLETIRKVLRYRAYVDERGERHLRLGDLRSLAREARDDLERLHKRIRQSASELAAARRSAAQLERDCRFIEARLRKREADAEG